MVALDLNTELYNEVKLKTNKHKEGTESMMAKKERTTNEQNTHTNPSWDK